jgi:hypothetical protein
MKTKAAIGLLLFLSGMCLAQPGGEYAFAFLKRPVGARELGIGSYQIAHATHDPTAVWQNPALLSDTVLNQGYFSWNPYFGVQATHIGYGYKVKKKQRLMTGMTYYHYGEIEQRDVNGTYEGSFQPNEYALWTAASWDSGPFRLGSQLTLAGSHIAGFSAYSVLINMGSYWRDPSENFEVGLVIRNVGFTLKNYIQGQALKEPLDIRLGLAYKPMHVPLRVHVALHHLQQWDLSYDTSPLQITQIGNDGEEEVPPPPGFGENLIRHFAFGAELRIAKSFQFRAGYDFLRRRDFITDTRKALAGVSWGFMVHTKKFEFGYTRAYYAVSGGTNMLQLTYSFSSKQKQ